LNALLADPAETVAALPDLREHPSLMN
jgi:hypothetical protein